MNRRQFLALTGASMESLANGSLFEYGDKQRLSEPDSQEGTTTTNDVNGPNIDQSPGLKLWVRDGTDAATRILNIADQQQKKTDIWSLFVSLFGSEKPSETVELNRPIQMDWGPENFSAELIVTSEVSEGNSVHLQHTEYRAHK